MGSPWCLGNYGLHDGYSPGYSECVICPFSEKCMALTGNIYVPKEVIRIVKSFLGVPNEVLRIEAQTKRRLRDNVE